MHQVYLYNRHMRNLSIPPKAQEVLLLDAAQRDPATARRTTLLHILLHERYLTREQLITRVEGVLQRNCFGKAAWQDTFYRDVRIVKQALRSEGYELLYSRHPRHPGYYLGGQPALSGEIVEILRLSAAEVDLIQLRIIGRMSPASRFRLGCSVSDTARKAVAYRIRQRNPDLSPAEANLQTVQRQSTS